MPVRGRGAFPRPDATFRPNEDAPSSSSPSCIAEYRALKKLPKSDEALALLRRVGQIVRPIMMKHNWRLPLLTEMYPKNDNLLGLNINRGQKISLRLRRPYDKQQFIDEESVVETMLHELTHNVRGPHDEAFFAQLEILTQEWYDVRANKRLPNEGFWTPGTVLGSAGGNTVGGRCVEGARRLNKELQEATARAAERRRAIAAGCPGNNTEAVGLASQEQEHQERIHGVEVIKIDDEDEGEGEGVDADLDDGVEFVASRRVSETIDGADDENDIVIVDVKKAPATQSLTSIPRNWACQSCTLLNPSNRDRCSACSTIRPGVPFWICRRCQHAMIGGFADLWCCSQCQTVKIA